MEQKNTMECERERRSKRGGNQSLEGENPPDAILADDRVSFYRTLSADLMDELEIDHELI